MFDHVTIRVSDRGASERFYATVLRALGIEPTYTGEDLAEWDDFSLAAAGDGAAVTRGLHVGFVAPTRAEVDAFWQVGTRAGYPDDGEPGPRPQYSPEYYGSFLLDPDGNSAEGVWLDPPRPQGSVDHVWMRVGDVAASRRFYETIAPFTGFRLANEEPGERASFAAEPSGFSVISDDRPRTENVHLAFAAPDDAAVDAFHRAALAAGYRDHGAPGERPEYHPGYYGAYVLDPDGNNVELVHHDRG